jgi:hypothetical protein
MSYDLCLMKQATKPYYIENIRTKIYSLEELCYYLYNNIYLIDDTIINEGLCDWIRDELGLTRLYRQLYEQLEKKDGAAFFIFPIFREIGYLTPQQAREFQEKLSRLAVQSADVRQKLCGDSLVRRTMFARAIGEYRQILSHQNPGKLGVQFYGSVWNNLGAAYAGLFQYEQAADCFFQAWKMTGTKEAFRKYISVLPLYLDEQVYEEKLKEVEADPYLVQKIQEYNGNLCLKIEPARLAKEMTGGDLDGCLQELKEQYCRSARS